MSFNINRPNSFKLSSLPKLHQPNLFALYHFDTKNLYKIQTKYTYSRDKQSPFTPDSITNISPHSIIVSPHLLITRHQTDRRSSNLIKTSPPSILVTPSRFVKRAFKRRGNTLHPLPCQACAPSLHMKSDILLATFVRGVCVSRRSWPNVAYRGFSSLRVPFRKTAGRSVRLGIALCHGRNSGCISTVAGARSWRYLESAKRETHASIGKMGKTASKLKSRRSQS